MNKKLTAQIICLVFLLGISTGIVGALSVNEEIKAILSYSLKIKLSGSDYTLLIKASLQSMINSTNGESFIREPLGLMSTAALSIPTKNTRNSAV